MNRCSAVDDVLVAAADVVRGPEAVDPATHWRGVYHSVPPPREEAVLSEM